MEEDIRLNKFLKLMGTYPSNIIILNAFYLIIFIVDIKTRNYVAASFMVAFSAIFTTLLKFVNYRFKKEKDRLDKEIEFLQKQLKLLEKIDNLEPEVKELYLEKATEEIVKAKRSDICE